jgi:hypothetical protein
MNIGDKVKFDTYICINPFTHQHFKKPLKKDGFVNRRSIVNTEENTVVKHISTMTQNKPLTGIYVGYRFRKLEWKYKFTTEDEDRVIRRTRLRVVVRQEPGRRSLHNPRRLDDPYKLDKVALVNMGVGRIIEVPMSNIIKYNCLKNYKLL